MTTKPLTDVLERAKSWPREDQETLAAYAREIESQRSGVYTMSDDERTAVNKGLAQADRGEFARDDEIDAFWTRVGVV